MIQHSCRIQVITTYNVDYFFKLVYVTVVSPQSTPKQAFRCACAAFQMLTIKQLGIIETCRLNSSRYKFPFVHAGNQRFKRHLRKKLTTALSTCNPSQILHSYIINNS